MATKYIGPPDKDVAFGSRFGDAASDAPADVLARREAALAKFGGFQGVGGNPFYEGAAPVTPPPVGDGFTSATGAGSGGPPDVVGAADQLREIFAPKAPAQAIPAPSAEGAQVPVAAQPAPLGANAPAPSKKKGGGGGGWAGIDNWLRTLMNKLVNDSGMGAELLGNLRNQATQTSKFRERDRIMRRGDDFAGRGLFGSGLQHDAIMGIEGEESVALQGSLNEIEFQNAQMIAQGLRDSIGVLQAMIAKKLGQGDLNIRREQLALQKAQLALQNEMFDWQQYLDKADRLKQETGGNFTDDDWANLFRDLFGSGQGTGTGTGSGVNTTGGGGGGPFGSNPAMDIYSDRTDSNSSLLMDIFGDPRGINSSWGGNSPWQSMGGGGGGGSISDVSPEWQLY